MTDLFYNREIEEAVLGACLVDIECFKSIQGKVVSDDFSIVSNQLIYASMLDLNEKNGGFDPLTVADDLTNKDQINRAGGVMSIQEMHQVIVETESFGYHVTELLRYSERRKLHNLGKEIMNKSADPNHDTLSIRNDAIEKLDTPHVSANIPLMTAEELVETEFPPTNWIVDDFLPEGLAVLAGSAKIGKSFLCWNLALSVAYGGVALSKFNVYKAKSVLYMPLEDPLNQIQDRLNMMTHDGDVPRNLFIVKDWPQHIKLDASGLSYLESLIDETEAEFVIIDTLANIKPGNNYNGTAYDYDYAVLRPIQQMAHDKNICIILVTHTTKTSDPNNPFNQMQGSTGVQGCCDTMMMLTKSEGQNMLSLTGRRVIPEEYEMEMDHSGNWSIVDSDYRPNAVSENCMRIIDLLYEAREHGLTGTQIGNETGIKSIRTVLSRMKNAGQVVQPRKRGKYYHPNYEKQAKE